MDIEEALNIIKKDTDIFLKIPYKNNYIYISYSKENNLFFYCDEFGVNNCKFKDGYNYVLLGILVDNNIKLNNIELKYKSQDAFDKYWNNFIYWMYFPTCRILAKRLRNSNYLIYDFCGNVLCKPNT